MSTSIDLTLSHPNPIRLKALFDTSLSKEEYESNRKLLFDSVKNIFNNEPVKTNFLTIYNIVESCSNNFMELFETLRQYCLNYVKLISPKLSSYPYSPKTNTESNVYFLNNVNDAWKTYCDKLKLLQCLFEFVDHKYWRNNPSCGSLSDMALKLWSDMFLDNSFIDKVVVLTIDIIKQHRMGSNSHIELSKSMCEMVKKLDLYSKYWEVRYVQEAQQFYKQDCEEKLKEFSDHRYLNYVTNKVEEETERSTIFLSGDFMPILFRDKLINIILTPHLNDLLNKIFMKLMQEKDFNNLETLYKLVHLSNSRKITENKSLDCLKLHFKEYVNKVGISIVENPHDDVEKDKKMTEALLNLKDDLDVIVNKCFNSDFSFHKTTRDCFEQFVNSRPNKPAEYLAKFLDLKLKSGNKNLSEDAMNVIMDKAMTLFRFITGKDVFEAFYLKDLAKRLLLGKSACVDTEKSMLEKLKHECGPNYTRKMEIMFSDMDNSQRFSKQFNESQFQRAVTDAIPDDSPFKGIEMNVHVICNATWPNLGGSKSINLPESLIELQNAYGKFYKSNHNGRKLRFEPFLGNCVVKAYFPQGKKELQVSEFQCMVLLQFNGDENICWTYQQLEDRLKIEPSDLKKTILSLSVGKGQKVLLKKPMTTALKEDDLFSFNENFHHKLTKIKFNQIQSKETKEEQQATEEQVFIDRQSHLDCYIVRLMKSHRQIEHTQLVTEVLKDLRFPVKGADIKKRIEHLIERDFISRDESNPSLYHYVA